MAILVEGMEMPKHDDEYVIFTVYGDGGVVYGPLNRPHVRYKHRAVPVPEPHGDLIDREELQHIIGQFSLNWEYGQGVSDCWDALLDAPTIIPESEEG